MKRSLFITGLIIIICSTLRSQSWAWAKSATTNSAVGMGVCADATGNVYSTGWFNGSSAVFGTYTLSSPAGTKMYLMKQDPSGNILWAQTATYNSDGYGISVRCDKGGNVYVVGTFNGSMAVFGTYTLTGTGQSLFLAKYDPAGNVLWAKRANAPSVNPHHLAVDNNGNVFVIGDFNGSTCTFGTYTVTNPGGLGSQAVFFAKYDTNGNVQWAKSAGGTDYDNGYSVATDTLGNSYITGFMDSPTMVFGSYTLTNTSNFGSAFFVKHDSNGNVVWAKNTVSLASWAGGQGYSIASDAVGNLYITGGFGGPFTIGTYSFSSSANPNLIKLDKNGNVAWYNNTIGSGGGYAVSTNGRDVLLSGGFTNYEIFGSYTLTSNSSLEAYPSYLVRFDTSGNVIYATDIEIGGDIHQNNNFLDDNCRAYFTSDFRIKPTTTVIGPSTLTLAGNMNPFVARLDLTCSVGIIENKSAVKQISLYPNPTVSEIKISSEDNIKHIEIRDLCGRLLYERGALNSTEVSLDVREFDPALYILVINSDSGVQTARFQKFD